MANRVHGLLAVAAIVILGIGFMGWRSLRTPAAPAGKVAPMPAPVPNAQVSELLPYVEPPTDSLRTVAAATDTIVLRRDPFAGQPLARAAEPAGVATMAGAEPRPRREAEEWHVTTTLLSGNRRAALINDALIYVGDPLPDGSRLTSVERDHVVVTDQKGAAHTVAVAKENNG